MTQKHPVLNIRSHMQAALGAELLPPVDPRHRVFSVGTLALAVEALGEYTTQTTDRGSFALYRHQLCWAPSVMVELASDLETKTQAVLRDIMFEDAEGRVLHIIDGTANGQRHIALETHIEGEEAAFHLDDASLVAARTAVMVATQSFFKNQPK